MIETIAISNGHEAGDDGAEHEQEDDQRRRQAERSSPVLQVAAGERVEVVVESCAAVTATAKPRLRSACSTTFDDRLRRRRR